MFTKLANNFTNFTQLIFKNKNTQKSNELVELPLGIDYCKLVIGRNITDEISVGIINKYNTSAIDNSVQGLKYRDRHYVLSKFKNETNKLTYEFNGRDSDPDSDHDSNPDSNSDSNHDTNKNINTITLQLTRTEPDIQYSLYNYESCFESGYVDNVIRKYYKKIMLESRELDEIYNFFHI